MADSPQVQPLPGLVEGGSAGPGTAAGAADPAAAVAHPAAAEVQDVLIHSHRFGCVLHILGGNSLYLLPMRRFLLSEQVSLGIWEGLLRFAPEFLLQVELRFLFENHTRG